MKICQVIFSTNRLEYLTKTLQGQKNLDFSDHQVDKIFFDDYPKDRNDSLVKQLVNLYGYEEIYLHKENIGLSATWTEFFNLIKSRHYDYIWHQEDDVVIKQPIKIDDLIELLNTDLSLSQVVLKRQPWYPGEVEEFITTDDNFFKNYRYNKVYQCFAIIASLYPGWVVHEEFINHYGFNLNEGMIMQYLMWRYPNTASGILKNEDGTPIIEHIGDYFHGKRICPDEPRWDVFNYDRFNPEKKYCSRTGYLYDDK